MKPMYKTLLPGLAGVAMLVFMASGAAAQNLKEQIVGTWTPVSRDVTMREMKIVPFGSHPLGYYMFDSSGHFSINLVNPDVPKFASGNQNTGTPAENQAAVKGNISYFGTYAINPDGSLTLHIIGSGFPNWNGTDQKRMAEINGDQLKWTDPTMTNIGGGAVAVDILTRAK